MQLARQNIMYTSVGIISWLPCIPSNKVFVGLIYNSFNIHFCIYSITASLFLGFSSLTRTKHCAGDVTILFFALLRTIRCISFVDITHQMNSFLTIGVCIIQGTSFPSSMSDRYDTMVLTISILLLSWI